MFRVLLLHSLSTKGFAKLAFCVRIEIISILPASCLVLICRIFLRFSYKIPFTQAFPTFTLMIKIVGKLLQSYNRNYSIQ